MYQALYRKYRSRTFDEVVGQKSVTQTLKAQVSNNRLSHAYLFTGVRGTGKTSCAKILSRAVNCLNPSDGNPCNCCSACKSILEGSCMDVLEIDAASNNGVDQVRALRDDAIYSPAEVQKRIYIIDEVHMLSTAAFNALLKIIEEPPAHLIFILATTEQDKVPATILSRCQRFSFRRLRLEDIAGRINYVAYQEGIDLTPDAAMLLARLADGALRDGLSLLDQCASASVGTVDCTAVYNCLGLAGQQAAVELMRSIMAHDTTTALRSFNNLYEQGKDVRALLNELCGMARDLLIIKNTTGEVLPMISGLADSKEAKQLASGFAASELLYMISLIQELLAGRAKSLNLRVDAEFCLIRICNPAVQAGAEALSARIGKLEEQLASGMFYAAASDTGDIPSEEPAPVEAWAPAFVEPEVIPASGDELPAGFWTELCESLQAELQPPAKGFFGRDNKLTVSKHGNRLVIYAVPFQKNIIGKPEILQIVSRKASALLHEKVTATVQSDQGFPGGADKLDEILSWKDAMGDRMTIQ